jgi:DNA-directed RNA polymerase specialized sigma subunit
MAMKLHQRLDQEAASLWELEPRPTDRLLALYQPYAERLADKRAVKHRLVDRDEYRQEALIALWESLERYDPKDDRACSFTTFVKYRIEFSLIEAERSNDWVKPKVRSAEKAGDIELPAMLRIRETFDTTLPEAEGESQWEVFVRLMAKAKPRVVNILQTYLDAGCDEDVAAAALNVKAEYFGQVLLPDAINELRGIPCRM